MYSSKINLATLLTVVLTISSLPVNVLILSHTDQVWAQTVNNREEEAKLLLQQGAAQLSNGNIASAREYLQTALAIYREIKERQGESGVLFFLGVSYRKQSDYNTAIDYYQQALKIIQGLPQRPNEGQVLIHLGDAYRLQNKYPQALQYYQQYLALDQRVQDNQNRIAVLGNMGRTYTGMNDLPKAIAYYQQALALAKNTSDRQNQIIILYYLSKIYLNIEDYAAAIDASNQGLALAKELSNSSAMLDFLEYLSTAYYFIADYDRAIQYAQQGLEVSRAIKDVNNERQAYNNIGNSYYQKREYDKAIENYQQVLKIARSQQNRKAEGQALGNIGLAYISKGEAAKAIDFLQQDLVIAQEFGDALIISQTLGYLGNAYIELKDYSKAVEYFQQGLVMTRKAKYSRGEAITLYNLSRALISLNKLPEAEKSLLETIEIWEKLREKLGQNDKYKVSIFEEQSRTYHLLQRVLIDQKKYDEALVISERGRARAFVDLLTLRLSANSQRSVNQIIDAKVEKPTLQLLQQIAKQQNATLIEYAIDYTINQSKQIDLALYIWVIKPTGEVIFRKGDFLPLVQEQKINIGQLVDGTRQAMGVVDIQSRAGGIIIAENENGVDKTSQNKRLKQLHEVLIKPIADILPQNPSDRVIFIPQGSLFLVPFPALQDEQGKYLIQKHTILTAPSIQVLDLTRKQKLKQRNSKLAKGEALVVGNPTMPRVALKPKETPIQLPPLQGAEREAKAIAPLLKTKAIIGNQATETAIAQKMPQARLIHLATHGLLDDSRGLGSAIALTPSAKDNGLLTAEEILNLKLNADLVVLSACDTGRGRITGDGVIGLSRSLISAGVPSVIVSLWAVDDNSTSVLMTNFYQNLEQNLDKATALRKAMLTTMQTNPEPLQWAAFTLIGEAQ
ncbi:CHAT domain-containing protein [Tolypothrix sp. FACHB-123]|uniref:CHAT domain-containing protein n=1 Tax=Tolypothrix sp. FACHB-123 TaxID=2692868 RepID=UPI001688502F|nr:CHAT domain-containing protein [Tolypothrix sp. FACHB-123]MBD2355137.1 CHAT domain-containing protein [Tolypothrix sp. FACHB-123]